MTASIKYILICFFLYSQIVVLAQIRITTPINKNVAITPNNNDTVPKIKLKIPSKKATPILVGNINNYGDLFGSIYNSRIDFVEIFEGGKEFGAPSTSFSTKKNVSVYNKKPEWSAIVDWKKISRGIAYGKWQISTLPFTTKDVKDIYILADGVVKNNNADSVRFTINYKYPQPTKAVFTNVKATQIFGQINQVKTVPEKSSSSGRTRAEQLTVYNKAALEAATNDIKERKLYIRMLLFNENNQALEEYSNSIVVKESYVEFATPALTEEQKVANKYIEERNADLKNLRDDYVITNIKYHPYFSGDPAYTGCTVVAGYQAGMEKHWLATSIPIGTVLCPKKNDSDGWFEKVFKSVTEFVKAVVDGASKFYNETKNYLKDKFKEFNCGNGGLALANPASKLNKLAGDEACEFISNVAFEAGMAAVGLPPSIPNTDVLMDMAKGQIVDVMCDKIEAETGVPLPDEVRDELKKQLNKQIEKAKNEGTTSDGILKLKPHPLTLFKPVYMEFEITRISKNYNKQLRLPVSFSIVDNTTRDVTDYQKNVGSGLTTLTDQLYEYTTTTIPYIENVGDKVTIYATLTPQNDRYLHMDSKGGFKYFSSGQTYNQDYYHIYDDTYERLISTSRAFKYLYNKESITVFDIGLKKAANVNVAFATSNK